MEPKRRTRNTPHYFRKRLRRNPRADSPIAVLSLSGVTRLAVLALTLLGIVGEACDTDYTFIELVNWYPDLPVVDCLQLDPNGINYNAITEDSGMPECTRSGLWLVDLSSKVRPLRTMFVQSSESSMMNYDNTLFYAFFNTADFENGYPSLGWTPMTHESRIYDRNIMENSLYPTTHMAIKFDPANFKEMARYPVMI